MQLYIENISCGGCARSVTASIKAVDPNANIHIDVEKKWVDIDTHIDEALILAALAEDDFPAQVRA